MLYFFCGRVFFSKQQFNFNGPSAVSYSTQKVAYQVIIIMALFVLVGHYALHHSPPFFSILRQFVCIYNFEVLLLMYLFFSTTCLVVFQDLFVQASDIHVVSLFAGVSGGNLRIWPKKRILLSFMISLHDFVSVLL